MSSGIHEGGGCAYAHDWYIEGWVSIHSMMGVEGRKLTLFSPQLDRFAYDGIRPLEQQN